MQIRPWFWIKIWPNRRLGVRPDNGFRRFSERYGFEPCWTIFGYVISMRRGDKQAPFFFGGWR